MIAQYFCWIYCFHRTRKQGQKGTTHGNALALDAACTGSHLHRGVRALLYALATTVKEEDGMAPPTETWKTASQKRKLESVFGLVVILSIITAFIVFPLFILPLYQTIQDGKWADGWTQVFRSKK